LLVEPYIEPPDCPSPEDDGIGGMLGAGAGRDGALRRGAVRFAAPFFAADFLDAPFFAAPPFFLRAGADFFAFFVFDFDFLAFFAMIDLPIVAAGIPVRLNHATVEANLRSCPFSVPLTSPPRRRSSPRQ